MSDDMTDDAASQGRVSMEIRVDVNTGGGRRDIAGRLRADHVDGERPFIGWLGLLAELEQLVDAAPAEQLPGRSDDDG